MKDEYDFTGAIRNPYMAKYKNQVSIMLDDETLAFLKEQAKVQQVPYKTLASLFLAYCAKEHSDVVVAPPVRQIVE